MNIKILGTGCARCHQLEKTAREVIKELGVEATLEEIKDITKIMEYPILATPGLVIDEKVVSSGQVPKKEDLKKLILKAMEKQ